MKKFKKKDLLKYFDGMCLFLANHHWTEIDERAMAIREMIQSPEMNFAQAMELRYKAQKDFRALELLLDDFKDSIQVLVKKIRAKKPEVTEEFVKEWAKKLEADSSPYNVDMGIDKEKLKQMLKEARVEVKKKK